MHIFSLDRLRVLRLKGHKFRMTRKTGNLHTEIFGFRRTNASRIHFTRLQLLRVILGNPAHSYVQNSLSLNRIKFEKGKNARVLFW